MDGGPTNGVRSTQPARVGLAGVRTSVAIESRRRRELLGWIQAEAARRSGVSRTAINEIEAGRRVPQAGRTRSSVAPWDWPHRPPSPFSAGRGPRSRPSRRCRSSPPALSPAGVGP
ncbi:MAG: helix-turn-helix transcriptional regulator [Candidatus Dormibacteraeota bacterium]|uniref:Helix-turn-helix transcriptional regulator n=1 Tax=Candidatus Aeolococcus gillhamiae TaxID=3127015 RepID=A0A934JR26_9BACT|nr:helix-turn-helix transcriptional regulator [Candidatus Dormibacteraeota bacterium]